MTIAINYNKISLVLLGRDLEPGEVWNMQSLQDILVRKAGPTGFDDWGQDIIVLSPPFRLDPEVSRFLTTDAGLDHIEGRVKVYPDLPFMCMGNDYLPWLGKDSDYFLEQELHLAGLEVWRERTSPEDQERIYNFLADKYKERYTRLHREGGHPHSINHCAFTYAIYLCQITTRREEGRKIITARLKGMASGHIWKACTLGMGKSLGLSDEEITTILKDKGA